ncbi:MAG: CRTAC1 family protein [Acidobacteriota bacterium]
MKSVVAMLLLSLAGAASVVAEAPAVPQLVDVAAELGLGEAATLHGGTKKKQHIPEAMPSGVAWVDFDLDGDFDLFLCTGGQGTPPGNVADAAAGPTPRLFRNELKETGTARFVDVTTAVGLKAAPGWSMGVAVADYDGDGDPDLHVTQLGPDRLLRNDLHEDGTRRLVYVAAELGIDEPLWGAGSAFGDIDGDGDLDLFVARYVDFDPSFEIANPVFSHWRGIEVFPGPVGLPGARDHLYRNQLVETGEPGFVEVSEKAGVADPEKRYGFAALFSDIDVDGDLDLFVANDSRGNYLYRNDGKGVFVDVGFRSGVAFSEDGKMQASMGATLGDCDGDGFMDVHVTNFSYDYNALHRSRRGRLFDDLSYLSGTGRRSWPDLGFGTNFLDVDRDGRQDLFVANGHIYPQVDLREFKTSYAQANRLYRNTSGAGQPCRYETIGPKAGSGMALRRVSRGSAAADFDGDGDLDLLVSELDAPPTLLRNEGPFQGGWVSVRCEGKTPNVFGIGARVMLTAGGQTQVREIRSSASYLCAEPPVAFFGVGSAKTVDVEVRFPSGVVVKKAGVKAGGEVTVSEAESRPAP